MSSFTLMLFQICMIYLFLCRIQKAIFSRMLIITKQFLLPLTSIMEYELNSQIFIRFFFYVPQKNVSHTGLELHEMLVNNDTI